jgi:hypothetical protein
MRVAGFMMARSQPEHHAHLEGMGQQFVGRKYTEAVFHLAALVGRQFAREEVLAAFQRCLSWRSS